MKLQLFWYYTNNESTEYHSNLVSVDVTSLSTQLPQETSFELSGQTFNVNVGSHTLFYGGLPTSKTLFLTLREVRSESGVSYEYVRSSSHLYEVTDETEKLYKLDLSKLYSTSVQS
jgi:hypothetical protein